MLNILECLWYLSINWVLGMVLRMGKSHAPGVPYVRDIASKGNVEYNVATWGDRRVVVMVAITGNNQHNTEE